MSAHLSPRTLRRGALHAGVSLTGVVVLAGCAGTSTSAPTPAAASLGPASTAAAADDSAASVTASGGWGHVHNIALDGSLLLLGTHDGLWEQAPGRDPARLSEDEFDVMGLAIDGARLLASGHPGTDMPGPADLGLGESTDGGRTWSEVSLGGAVDFHRLVASGDTVMGISASDDKVLKSIDGGATWADLGSQRLFDLALDPKDASSVLATSESGPVRSMDGGTTFAPITGAPLLVLLAWTDGRVYGVGVDGRVYGSTDSGQTWATAGKLDGQPAALAANGEHVVAVVGDIAMESSDAGATFTPRITGIA
jgi:photosystem II stability/assembly factor-like uncharacterized protein